MKKKNVLALSASSLFLLSGIASASTITTNYTDGTRWNVASVANYDTTGNTMDGLSVTVYFANENVGSRATWTDEQGAVSTDGWALTFFHPDWGYNGSTYSAFSAWNLSNTSQRIISSLVIDGRSSNIVFDTIYPALVTPGSAEGWSIETRDSSGLAVTADYSNFVSVLGTSYYDNTVRRYDLYSTLTLSFANGFSNGAAFSFNADTDNVNPVPEPGTMLLLGTGLAGLAGMRMRRKNNLINEAK